jgi:hypothetical protein
MTDFLISGIEWCKKAQYCLFEVPVLLTYDSYQSVFEQEAD